METILIVDDEKNYPPILSAILEEEGFETLTANSGQEALGILKTSEVDLVLTDMKMPTMDGIQLLKRIKADQSDIPVIMMTAHGTVERAVEAMQKGAHNYILKPFDNEHLILVVNKAVAVHRVLKENQRLRLAVQSRYSFGNIIGKSKAMHEIFHTIRKVAPTAATVLIEGESGTGKEMVARALHFNSSRGKAPFIAVNCAALAENLLESELFGHEKGAFTGAINTKKGRFELASGGTLFLDEIAELPQHLQVKLLRTLQEWIIERVGGGGKPISVDIRLIAATNRILKDEIKAGNFREDLFFRLNVVHIQLPALRQRQQDIPLLVDHFIHKIAGERKIGIQIKSVEPEVERFFFSYSWPGNIRELENVIERAMILSPGETITFSDLPKDYQTSLNAELDLENIPQDAKLSETLAMIEKKMILRALTACNNIQAHAATLLGIGKSGLNQKIKKYHIDKQLKN